MMLMQCVDKQLGHPEVGESIDVLFKSFEFEGLNLKKIDSDDIFGGKNLQFVLLFPTKMYHPNDPMPNSIFPVKTIQIFQQQGRPKFSCDRSC